MVPKSAWDDQLSLTLREGADPALTPQTGSRSNSDLVSEQ